jgi:membrane protein YqaA with SNARE-associated domain
MNSEYSEGFYKALFDTSFSEFIIPKIISVLFIIGMIMSGISALALVVLAFTQSILGGILALFLSPVYFLISVIVIRFYFEIIVILFKIYYEIKESNALKS